MEWQWAPYMILLLIVAGTLILLTLYIFWRRHDFIGAKTGVLILLAIVEWILGYVLELGCTKLPAKIFWNKIQYFGIAVIPVLWFIFVLKYTRSEKWLTRRSQAQLFIVPFLILLLVFTNKTHGLIWTRVELMTHDSFLMLSHTLGIGFWIFIAYSYVLLLFAFFLILQVLVHTGRVFRWQVRALLFAAFLPWLTSALQFAGFNPFKPFEVIPLSFAVSGPVWVWGFVKIRWEDIVTVSRDLVMDAVSDGVIVLDAQYRIIDLNSAAKKMVGVAFLSAIRQPLKSVWEELFLLVDRFPDGQESNCELIRNIGNNRYNYDVRISSLPDFRGIIISRVIVLRDITGRIRTEEEKAKLQAQLIQSEKMAGIGTLTSGIAHEFNNFLQIMSGNVQLAKRTKRPKDMEEALDIVAHTSDRVSKIIRDLLVFSKQESSEIEQCDITEPLESMLSLIERQLQKCNIEIVRKYEKTPQVCMNMGEMQQVFLNVIKNAQEAMIDRGGKLEIYVRQVDRNVVVSFKDMGVGVEENDLNKLFEPFFTTKKAIEGSLAGSGTGLGLSVSYAIVKRHDGKIEVKSKKGEGTTFTVELPLRRVNKKCKRNK